MKNGTGTSVSFEDGFLAEILEVTPPGAKRESIDVSHMLTVGARRKIPGTLFDNGQLKCKIGFDPGATPPIDQPASEVVVTFPDGETWTFQGFMVEYTPTDPMEDKMTAEVAIECDGDITIAGGS